MKHPHQVPHEELHDEHSIAIAGIVWKKNNGFLRSWRQKHMTVTNHGYLIYKKKDNMKQIDLLSTNVFQEIKRSGDYHCIELKIYITKQNKKKIVFGLCDYRSILLWLRTILAVVDENANGRREWINKLVQLIRLPSVERQLLLPNLLYRDWITEWNSCLQKLNLIDDFMELQSRYLKRLYTIWLHFYTVTEILLEVFASAIRKSHANNHKGFNDQAIYKDFQTYCQYTNDHDTESLWFPSIRIEFATKLFNGRTRLRRHTHGVCSFANQILNTKRKLFNPTSANRTEHHINHNWSITNFPLAMLVSTFELIGGYGNNIPVIITAHELGSNIHLSMQMHVTTMNTKELEYIEQYGQAEELSETTNDDFSCPKRERMHYKSVLIRRYQHRGEESTCIGVESSYNDVFYTSLRPQFVHGVIIRKYNSSDMGCVSILSAKELLRQVTSRGESLDVASWKWLPFVNLYIWILVTNSTPNCVPTSLFIEQENCIFGDVVISTFPPNSCTNEIAKKNDLLHGVDNSTYHNTEELSHMKLHLNEQFVQKYYLELHPLIRRLEEMKSAIRAIKNQGKGVTHKIFADARQDQVLPLQGASESMTTQADTTDVSKTKINDAGQQLLWDCESRIKDIILQHVINFSRRIVTLGDDGISIPHDSKNAHMLKNICSTKDAMIVRNGKDLRQLMKEAGINFSLLPLVFYHLCPNLQKGIRKIVAATIVTRIVKHLIYFRIQTHTLTNDAFDHHKWIISFIKAVTHGVVHNNHLASCPSDNQRSDSEFCCIAEQFWNVDGYIWLCLGPFARAFAILEEEGKKILINAMSDYREALWSTPGLLFNSCLTNLQMYLKSTYNVSHHERRFDSDHFLRDPADFQLLQPLCGRKSIKVIHSLLKLQLHYFHLHYNDIFHDNFSSTELSASVDRITRNEINISTVKSSTMDQEKYYKHIRTEFFNILEGHASSSCGNLWQHSVKSAGASCVGPVICLYLAITEHEVWNEILSLIKKAIGALQVSDYKTASYACLTAVSHINRPQGGTKAQAFLFPAEFLIIFRCIDAICASEMNTSSSFAMLPLENDSISNAWQVALMWLYCFFRPINNNHFLMSMSSHPIYFILRKYELVHGLCLSSILEEKRLRSTTPKLSLRSKLELQQLLELWETAGMADINYQTPNLSQGSMRVSTYSDTLPSEVTFDNLLFGQTKDILCKTQQINQKVEDEHNRRKKGASYTTITPIKEDVNGQNIYLAPPGCDFSTSNNELAVKKSSTKSNRGNLLRELELLIPRSISNALNLIPSELIRLETKPDVVSDKSEIVSILENTSQIFLARSKYCNGVVLLWGNPMGLSLDDEAKVKRDKSQFECQSNQADETTQHTASVSCSIRPESHPKCAEDVSWIRPPKRLGSAHNVSFIACGYRHTALITEYDQMLYTFGHGECGRLGHGNEDSQATPKLVEFFASAPHDTNASNYSTSKIKENCSSISTVACGREHTMVITTNGKLYAFGWAEAGRLGLGEDSYHAGGSVLSPILVPSVSNVKLVACGREHTLIVTNHNGNSENNHETHQQTHVYACGAGFGGRLGIGNENDAEEPSLINSLEGKCVISIDAGECHSCALTADGKVFTWGFGGSGALGHGNTENEYIPKEISPTIWQAKGIYSQNSVWQRDSSYAKAIAIACGGYHTLVSTDAGELYGWGDCAAGQLGDEYAKREKMIISAPRRIHIPWLDWSPILHENTHRNSHLMSYDYLNVVSDVKGNKRQSNPIRQITCGTYTSAITTQNGRVFVWGSPIAGNGATLNIGDAKVSQVLEIEDFPIAQVACGTYHTVVRTTCWKSCQ